MKKQELIHLHGLMAEMRFFFEELTGEIPDTQKYDELGVRPTSIHKSKTDHKTALFTLAEELNESLDDDVQDYANLWEVRLTSNLQRKSEEYEEIEELIIREGETLDSKVHEGLYLALDIDELETVLDKYDSEFPVLAEQYSESYHSLRLGLEEMQGQWNTNLYYDDIEDRAIIQVDEELVES